jgi:hypothetical protein
MFETELAFSSLCTSLEVEVAKLGHPHATEVILHAEQFPLRHSCWLFSILLPFADREQS